MSRPVHFEVQADDVERAKAFYAAVFGWEYQDWSSVTGSTYWGITTGPEGAPGINGGLLHGRRPAPADGPGTNGSSSRCRSTTTTPSSAGSSTPAAVALPKFAMPGMAWQGYYLDPEGNTFGLHQADPSAA